ncbi:hypothetical protein MIDIC_280010 [Alphaproteobacteria bacterium]
MKQVKLDLTVVLKGPCVDIKNIPVTIGITNNDAKDYFISSDAILWDGFTSDKFCIVSEKGDRVDYIGRMVKYKPEDILLQSGHTIEKTVNLAETYDIHPEKYSFSYSTCIGYHEKDQNMDFQSQAELLQVSDIVLDCQSSDVGHP